MAAFKCFICGKYAGDKMKCGTWICKDHIKLLGGMRNWREIRFMTPEQVYFRLGVDKGNMVFKGFTPSEKDQLWRDGMKAGQQLSNSKKTVVLRYGGCLVSIIRVMVLTAAVVSMLVWLVGTL